jgi:Family of unknown function (DUF6411)
MTIAVIIVLCAVLLVLAFLLPRFSWYPQRGVDRTLEAGRRTARRAPGRSGELLEKPFSSAERAVDKSAAAGRKGRSKAES